MLWVRRDVAPNFLVLPKGAYISLIIIILDFLGDTDKKKISTVI
jgi:hypothetical protein